MRSVVRAWLSEASLKQQTVMLCALRGCDGLPKEDPAKDMVRWIRSVILISADNGSTFMKEPDFNRFWENGIDHYPVHWLLHFAHACQIIGYFCPDEREATRATDFYEKIVSALHLKRETYDDNRERLRDMLR